MSQFESQVVAIPYSQQRVYDMLSDLSHLESVKDRIPQDKVKDLTFDRDTVSVNVAPVGDIAFKIIEREEPKCVKLEATTSPIPLTIWIQMLPTAEEASKMKLTLRTELPIFMKGMIQKPLQEGLEKIADMLAAIKY
ncbi:MAG: SRPBCC family protein [Bacteroidaceae bacterium]|nr:SRPBCC family protein [Bacteroidaceae bacterium]MBQ3237471.1 SRPBCC family protein [Bacteroidaceae bacterium]MBQ7966660.1 SRPBCC family protein [Bacteroidaceae bacterium]MBR3985412.1 SRPBCC family protein [Bacteroidaceae bacterium]MBR4041378.1 SRPBCC family protein [Bacteroidaceae bacterium]